MEQVAEYVEDIKLLKVLDKYKNKHEIFLKEAAEELKNLGEEPEKPGKMAATWGFRQSPKNSTNIGIQIPRRQSLPRN